MHLLYLSSPGGGLDTYVRVLAPALVKAGHHVSVLYIYPKSQPALAAEGGNNGLEIHNVSMGDWHYYARRATFGLTSLPLIVRGLEYARALANAISSIHSKRPIDLIELPEVFLTPRQAGHLPYFIRLHSAGWTWRRLIGERLDLSDALELRMEGFSLRGANGVSSPSSMLADYISANCGLGDRHTEIIPYPIDTVQFSPGDGLADPPLVLFVGRVETRKGVDVLMRAIPLVLAKRPECEFVFAGCVGDDVLGKVEKSQALKLLGVRPHHGLPGLYQRASVFVAPSLWDNSPNTIYEAMACGTPVVASRVGGIPELVDDGVTGLLVPPRDERALADAIVALLDDPVRRARMGQCGREKAVARYSVDKIAAQTLDFYQRALQRGKVRLGINDSDDLAS